MKKLSLKLKIYFLFVYIITIGLFILFVKRNYIAREVNINGIYEIVFFSVLTMITESFTISFRKISFSTTFCITIASYILYGPMTCIIIFIIGYTFRVLKLEDNKYKHFLNTPFYGTAFNYCILTLPIFIGNYFYIIMGGEIGSKSILDNILQLGAFGIIYFFLNTFLISIIQGLSINKNIIYCFVSNVRLMILNILAMVPLGVLLAVVFIEYHYVGVLLLIVPILLIRYTFSLYVDSKSQYMQTVDALMHAIEARDKYTEGHCQRVAEIACQIAKQLKYNQWKLEQLNMAAMLHDVGKIGICDDILNKPGKLTIEEYSIIKQHPVIGYDIIKKIRNLENIAEIVKYHHERYDGKGYPEGKKGEELSMDIYIIQLADSVDAMKSDRPYRKALTEDEIIDEIEQNTGTQFHPDIAKIYLNILKN